MIKTAIITLSDRCYQGKRRDESCPAIKQVLLKSKIGFKIIKYILMPDDKKRLVKELSNLADKIKVDLIITTGGTGLSCRDITPEATREVIEKEVPGFPEIMRLMTFKYTKRSILSRGISGIRKKTLIINLPGSPKAVRQSLALILPAVEHGVEVLRGEARE